MMHSEPQLLYKHGGGPVLQCQHQTAGLAHPCDLSLSLVPLTQELQQHQTPPLTGMPSFSVQVRDEGAGRILTEARLGK